MTLKHFLTRTAVAAAVVAIAGAAGAAEKQMTADIVVVGKVPQVEYQYP